jgi:hypothetical protein
MMSSPLPSVIQSQRDLTPTVASGDNGISITPLLLNPGDRFRITVQLRGDFSEPEVAARISGVPAIVRHPLRGSALGLSDLFLLMAFGVLGLASYFYLAGAASRMLTIGRAVRLPLLDGFLVILAVGAVSAGSFAYAISLMGWSSLPDWQFVAGLVSLGLPLALLGRYRSRRAENIAPPPSPPPSNH